MWCSRNFLISNKIRRFSTKSAFSEIKIPVPWGHIAGKWWGPTDKRPILTIHGWQDNCGSFDRLIPLLNPNVGFLAIDLPGHGLSSRLPPGAYYHNMNYPILIKSIAHYFNWPKISLMGHSLGGISSYIYTMIFPESVDFLICLDGVKPIYKTNNATRMAVGIQEVLKYDEHARRSGEPPCYPIEVMKEKLSQLNNGSIAIEHCHHILQRNVAPSKLDPNKYYFTRDPRLKARLILNWSQRELVEGAYRVTPPLLMIKFKGSGYFENKENFYEILEVLQKTSRDASMHYVDGLHHTHLNNPESINTLINSFLDKYNTEDRQVGGLQREIVNA